MTGLAPSCSTDLPIFVSPSARIVPRWRGDWPIVLLIWVNLSFDTGCFQFRLGLWLRLRRLVGQNLADRLAARLRDVFGAAQVAKGALGRLQHVDRVRRPE